MLRTDLDISVAKRKIISFIKAKVETSQTDGVVLELNGDVNSAVTAHLSVEALGARRVIGLIMPDLRLPAEEDTTDSKTVAEELCLETRVFDIAPIHKSFMKVLEGNRIAEENLRSRIRMSLLYYHANLLNRLVTGSLDKSELLLGSFTKYGGDGVDILPIADLYRSQVMKLSEVLGINRRIVTKNRAKRRQHGRLLVGTKFDLDYNVLDQLFKLRLDLGLDTEYISSQAHIPRAGVESVVTRYESSSHKRKRPEICALHEP